MIAIAAAVPGKIGFLLGGIEPWADPAWQLGGAKAHAAYWAEAARVGAPVRRRSIAKGLDKDGKPLAKITKATRLARKRPHYSPMGKASPNAPPLTPCYGLSRTRCLLRATPTQAGVWFDWGYDKFTRRSWGEILDYHRRGIHGTVRDVIGLPPADRAQIAAAMATWWAKERGKYLGQPAASAAVVNLPGAIVVPSMAGVKAKPGATYAGPPLVSMVVTGGIIHLDAMAAVGPALPGGSGLGFLVAPAKPKPKAKAAKPIAAVVHPIVYPRTRKPQRAEKGAAAYPLPTPPPSTVAAPAKKAAPKPRAKPAKAPAATQAPLAAFPATSDGLKLVRALGGSTGAELVEDGAGNRFVRKRGASADHLREEALADGAYRDLGAAVPESRVYDTPSGPVKLARYVDGETLGDLLKRDPKAAEAAMARLREHFAADALLGNWDVVGMNYDNVLVAPDGTPYRIDNGGSLRFRAQGARKTAAQWDDYPTELWTLRDAKANPQTAKAFAALSAEEIAAQIRAMKGKSLTLPKGLAETVKARMAQLEDYARTIEVMTADRFRGEYADRLARHAVGIRKAGIAARMPAKMKRKLNAAAEAVEVYDEKGRMFDSLRGKDSLVDALHAYLKAIGGNPVAIEKWMSAQAGSSWLEGPAALKSFLAAQRTVADDGYYWHKPVTAQTARDSLEKARKKAGGGDAYDEAFTALHAFTREYLTRAEFDGKDPARGTIRLMRTETKEAMKANKLKRGAKGAMMKRGVAESTSLYRKVSVKGNELTVQDVPIHRVIATYWQERTPGQVSGAFLGDAENEFVAMLEGVPLDYQ